MRVRTFEILGRCGDDLIVRTCQRICRHMANARMLHEASLVWSHKSRVCSKVAYTTTKNTDIQAERCSSASTASSANITVLVTLTDFVRIKQALQTY